MSTARVVREIASSPASIALLLADPETVGLWPGASAHGLTAGVLHVEVDGRSGELRVPPASRDARTFVLGFDFSDGAGVRVVGRLRLRELEDRAVTEAALEVAGGSDLSEPAGAFLDRIAETARARSLAA